MSRYVCLLMLSGCVAVLGCNQKPSDSTAPNPKVTSEDVRRDVDQAAKTAGEFAQQAKEEFVQKLEAQLKALDEEVAKLREKGSELKDEAKASWDKKMAELETKREAAKAKLAEVRESSGEAWKDVQRGAEAACEDLNKSLQDAKREF